MRRTFIVRSFVPWKLRPLMGEVLNMKLFVNGSVYLQKYDVAFLTHHTWALPEPDTILAELFQDGKPFSMIGKEDGYKFACRFRDPKNIEWLREQDWIPDFTELSKISALDLQAMHDKLSGDHRSAMAQFNCRDEEHRQKYYSRYQHMFAKTSHKLHSIATMHDYLLGQVKFDLP